MTDTFTGVYAADADVSVDSIVKELGIQDSPADVREIASEVLEVCEAGYSFGLQGMYPDSEFGSDADFVYGTGDTIQNLEFRLENAGVNTDDGPVFEMFREAHSVGLAHFEDTQI
jgi:hypothetical protein